MKSLEPISRIFWFILGVLAYCLFAAILVGIAIGFKVIALLVADKLLYSILLLGDILRGIEIIELFNIVVFAILGMGFGMASWLLPASVARKISAALLMILVPLVVLATPITRYHIWINAVSNDEQISLEEAEKLSNLFLKKKIATEGFWGYYFYTAQFPVLPTNQSNMNDLDKLERRVNSRFVRLTGAPPTLITGLMTLCFWGLRVFYFAVAAITTIAHFRDGLRIAKR